MTDFFTNIIQQLNWVEVFAVVLALAYVILAAYESNWCWPAAALSVVLYIYICFSAKLYSETVLQAFYLVMAFYGWWQWKNKSTDVTPLTISSIGTKNHLILFAVGLALTGLLYFVMKNYTDAALPFPDAIVTAFSLVATFMVTRKIMENWLWWVVIDSLAVYIYMNRNLHLTAVLYFIYVIIAIAGYIRWKNEFLQQRV